MVSIRLPEEMEIELTNCAKNLKITKSKIINDALSIYLEDLQLYMKAKEVLEKDEPTYTHEELKHEFGL